MMLSDSPDMSYFDLGVSDWKNPDRNDLGIDAKKARSITTCPIKVQSESKFRGNPLT